MTWRCYIRRCLRSGHIFHEEDRGRQAHEAFLSYPAVIGRGFPVVAARAKVVGQEETQMDFTGKVALITGGGGGIGRATALGFALRGAKVMVVDQDAESGQATADIVTQRGGDVKFTPGDVTKSASVKQYVQATLDAFGRIDCFFNNAGIEGKIVPTQEYDEDVFDQVIAVNLKGVFLGLRHVLPVMLQQGSGTVVNTASVAGLFGGPGMPAYGASMPTGRYTLPEEVAGVVLYLSSELSGNVTGTHIVVDGGRSGSGGAL